MAQTRRITLEVLARYAEQVQTAAGEHTPPLEEYLERAQRREAEGDYFAAAVYYRLAALRATPTSRSRIYEAIAEELSGQVRLTLDD